MQELLDGKWIRNDRNLLLTTTSTFRTLANSGFLFEITYDLGTCTFKMI